MQVDLALAATSPRLAGVIHNTQSPCAGFHPVLLTHGMHAPIMQVPRRGEEEWKRMDNREELTAHVWYACLALANSSPQLSALAAIVGSPQSPPPPSRALTSPPRSRVLPRCHLGPWLRTKRPPWWPVKTIVTRNKGSGYYRGLDEGPNCNKLLLRCH